MDIVNRNVSVVMVRRDLDDVPAYPLPPKYAVRWHQPGDEELWVRIQTSAEQYSEISLDLFRRAFDDDASVLAQRQLFLLDHDGVGIGTASAWYDNDHHGQRYGLIHWIAIVPACQGRGLAKPLLSRVCHRLRDLGHDKARLNTSTARIAALNLYVAFGFVPDIASDADARVWRELAPHLKAPPDLPARENGGADASDVAPY